MNKKAWDGISILIFGRQAGAAMQLEQQIAEAAPDLESRIESFENYEDALDHCKAVKDVGFLIFLEDGGTPTSDEIFRNLAKPYEKSGWPGFATLLHDGVETIQGLKILNKNSKFIDYRDRSEFIETDGSKNALHDLWKKFSEKVSKHFIDSGLENTLLSTASVYLPPGYLLFHEQALNVLSTNLALSWRDLFILRWHPVVKSLQENIPQTLYGHEQFIVVISSVDKIISKEKDIIETIKDTSIPLQTRLLKLIYEMNSKRCSESLSTFIEELAAHGKPGSPAIFRHIAKNRQALQTLAEIRKAG